MLIPNNLDVDLDVNFDVELDQFVERFEAACAQQPGVDVTDYMPDPQHPRYAIIGCELLRVHMELSAAAGKFVTAVQLRERYPIVCGQAELFQALQAEELRVLASRSAAIMHRSTLTSTSEPAQLPNATKLVEMPKPGEHVAGFRLLTELGRGAFSQVFLAEDDSLSRRRVVLKISSKLQGEANLLSRLQHKNIVPVYSLHRHGQYHLICMPFLGTMTLADMSSSGSKSLSILSGKELISTLAAHASRTWKEGDPSESQVPSEDKLIENNSSENTPVQPVSTGLSSQLAAEVASMSTTQLALWIVSELADGLAHAHERGVHHRDIKPANVLLSDDGLPMLLDFNLATSTRPNDHGQKVVGGTLRYMSPEQIASVQNQQAVLDARADVYSLGVVLYELLCGVAPFADRTGTWNEVLQQMLSDRQVLPKLDIQWRNGLTPAVHSILMRALAFDASQRYQSAAEFRDDLRAQLQARPLLHAQDRSVRERIHKWNMRHPRLSSITIAAGLITCILCATLVWAIQRQTQLNHLQAAQWLRQLEDVQSEARSLIASDFAPTRAIEQWLDRSATVLSANAQSGLMYLPASERARAKECLGRVHLYRARGALGLSQRSEAASSSQWQEIARRELVQSQQLEPSELTAAWLESLDMLQRGKKETRGTAASHVSIAPGESLIAEHRDWERVALEQELGRAMASAHTQASNSWHWIGVGQIQLSLGKLDEAAASFALSHTLSKRESLPTFFLGLIEMQRKNFRQAEVWFTATLAEDPQCWEAWLNRAATRVELARYTDAIDDVVAMGKQADRYPRAWFIRELAEAKSGQTAAAATSRQRGLQLTPTDALGWNARGQAKLKQKPADAAGALADFDMAIQLDPNLRNAYENAAHVLSERLNQPQAAIQRLGQVLEICPDYALAWSSRSVLLARQGQFEAASADIQAALRLDRSPMICYQCASALALIEAGTPEPQGASPGSLSDSGTTSLQLLKETLRKEPSLSQFMRQDADLRALLNNPEFRSLITAAARLQDLTKD